MEECLQTAVAVLFSPHLVSPSTSPSAALSQLAPTNASPSSILTPADAHNIIRGLEEKCGSEFWRLLFSSFLNSPSLEMKFFCVSRLIELARSEDFLTTSRMDLKHALVNNFLRDCFLSPSPQPSSLSSSQTLLSSPEILNKVSVLFVILLRAEYLHHWQNAFTEIINMLNEGMERINRHGGEKGHDRDSGHQGYNRSVGMTDHNDMGKNCVGNEGEVMMNQYKINFLSLCSLFIRVCATFDEEIIDNDGSKWISNDDRELNTKIKDKVRMDEMKTIMECLISLLCSPLLIEQHYYQNRSLSSPGVASSSPFVALSPSSSSLISICCSIIASFTDWADLSTVCTPQFLNIITDLITVHSVPQSFDCLNTIITKGMDLAAKIDHLRSLQIISSIPPLLKVANAKMEESEKVIRKMRNDGVSVGGAGIGGVRLESVDGNGNSDCSHTSMPLDDFLLKRSAFLVKEGNFIASVGEFLVELLSQASSLSSSTTGTSAHHNYVAQVWEWIDQLLPCAASIFGDEDHQVSSTSLPFISSIFLRLKFFMVTKPEDPLALNKSTCSPIKKGGKRAAPPPSLPSSSSDDCVVRNTGGAIGLFFIDKKTGNVFLTSTSVEPFVIHALRCALQQLERVRRLIGNEENEDGEADDADLHTFSEDILLLFKRSMSLLPSPVSRFVADAVNHFCKFSIFFTSSSLSSSSSPSSHTSTPISSNRMTLTQTEAILLVFKTAGEVLGDTARLSKQIDCTNHPLFLCYRNLIFSLPAILPSSPLPSSAISASSSASSTSSASSSTSSSTLLSLIGGVSPLLTCLPLPYPLQQQYQQYRGESGDSSVNLMNFQLICDKGDVSSTLSSVASYRLLFHCIRRFSGFLHLFPCQSEDQLKAIFAQLQRQFPTWPSSSASSSSPYALLLYLSLSSLSSPDELSRQQASLIAIHTLLSSQGINHPNHQVSQMVASEIPKIIKILIADVNNLCDDIVCALRGGLRDTGRSGDHCESGHTGSRPGAGNLGGGSLGDHAGKDFLNVPILQPHEASWMCSFREKARSAKEGSTSMASNLFLLPKLKINHCSQMQLFEAVGLVIGTFALPSSISSSSASLSRPSSPIASPFHGDIASVKIALLSKLLNLLVHSPPPPSSSSVSHPHPPQQHLLHHHQQHDSNNVNSNTMIGLLVQQSDYLSRRIEALMSISKGYSAVTSTNDYFVHEWLRALIRLSSDVDEVRKMSHYVIRSSSSRTGGAMPSSSTKICMKSILVVQSSLLVLLRRLMTVMKDKALPCILSLLPPIVRRPCALSLPFKILADNAVEISCDGGGSSGQGNGGGDGQRGVECGNGGKAGADGDGFDSDDVFLQARVNSDVRLWCCELSSFLCHLMTVHPPHQARIDGEIEQLIFFLFSVWLNMPSNSPEFVREKNEIIEALSFLLFSLSKECPVFFFALRKRGENGVCSDLRDAKNADDESSMNRAEHKALSSIHSPNPTLSAPFSSPPSTSLNSSSTWSGYDQRFLINPNPAILDEIKNENVPVRRLSDFFSSLGVSSSSSSICYDDAGVGVSSGGCCLSISTVYEINDEKIEGKMKCLSGTTNLSTSVTPIRRKVTSLSPSSSPTSQRLECALILSILCNRSNRRRVDQMISCASAGSAFGGSRSGFDGVLGERSLGSNDVDTKSHLNLLNGVDRGFLNLINNTIISSRDSLTILLLYLSSPACIGSPISLLYIIQMWTVKLKFVLSCSNASDFEQLLCHYPFNHLFECVAELLYSLDFENPQHMKIVGDVICLYRVILSPPKTCVAAAENPAVMRNLTKLVFSSMLSSCASFCRLNGLSLSKEDEEEASNQTMKLVQVLSSPLTPPPAPPPQQESKPQLQDSKNHKAFLCQWISAQKKAAEAAKESPPPSS